MSILCSKPTVRRDGSGGQRWVTHWHGLPVGALQSRDYAERWSTWEGARDCALAVARSWCRVELHANAILIRHPSGTTVPTLRVPTVGELTAEPSNRLISPALIEQESRRWMR